jgi:hypothetical protein
MWNKIGLLVAIATLPLIQSVSSAQDEPSPSASTKTYEIVGFFGAAKISGSYTANNSNNDEVIDKSELSDFKLILNSEKLTISCPLAALNKFQISDFPGNIGSVNQLGMENPADVIKLEISCQSKDAQFSLSNSKLQGKIKTRSNHSQSEQNSDFNGMQITYSTGTSSRTIEFEMPLYLVEIRKINQNSPQSINIQTSPEASNI